MATYLYRAADGTEVEIDRPVGTAPPSIRRKGVVYARAITMPHVRKLSGFDRGVKRSVSHQLPQWYGFGGREEAWQDRMKRLGVPDTKEKRMQVLKSGLAPTPKEVFARGRANAAKAGKLDCFDSKGKPVAETNRKARDHAARGQHKYGDAVAWE